MTFHLLFSRDLDVARHIIELAASDDTPKRKTARDLSLVSKQVQSWADPWIFRDVVVSSRLASTPICRLIDAVIHSSPKQPRFQRITNCIQTFTCTAINDPENRIPRFLECCPNIFSIALRGISLPVKALSARGCYANLRKACFLDFTYDSKKAGQSSEPRIPLLRLPLFQNLTHLDWSSWDFKDWSTVLWKEAGLASVPSLTHLAMTADDEDEQGQPLNGLTEIFRALSEECKLPPSLKVLLLLVSEGHMHSLSHDDTENYDSRIVLALSGPLCIDSDPEFDNHDAIDLLNCGWRVWRHWTDPISFWDAAERVLQRRNFKEASEQDQKV
ncbi:hypothetical protein DL96DRAFT_1812829 [Flagelloscypha sp. PMI_526]|nr:hypothetical protein DL96DRAFT_1812829 [Flagelloscypha sp. PMI_526]